MQQIVLGALGATCVVLVVIMAILWRKANKVMSPVTQNFVCFDMKQMNLVLKGGLVAISVTLNPDDFRVYTEKLYQKFIEVFTSEVSLRDLETRAMCILNQAGLDSLIGAENRRKFQPILVRLLINGDDEAIHKFLRTVAESACAVQPEVLTTLATTD
jgi:hypothetical protein